MNLFRVFLFALCAFAATCRAGAADAAKPAATPEWKNIDDSHYLGGGKISAGDLNGMVVLMIRFPINNFPSESFLADVTAVRRQLDPLTRYIEVCSVTGDKKALAVYEKKYTAKTKAKNFPAFEGMAYGEESEAGNPRLVVIDHKGKTVFRGDDAKKAAQAARKAIKSLPPPDPYFGIEKIEHLASATNLVVKGRSLAPVYAALRKSAAGKDADAAEEAKRLMAALDQSGHLRISAAMRMLQSSPGRTSILLEETVKMWPKAKSDERVAYLEMKLKKLEELSKSVKIIEEIERLSQIDPATAKPSDLKKALASATALKQRVGKLKDSKSYGIREEASHLENDLFSLVSRFGGE